MKDRKVHHDAKLRSMIVDCIKEHKKRYGWWYDRPYTIKTVYEENINIKEVTLQDLIDIVRDSGYSLDNLIVGGFSQDSDYGYDGFVHLDLKVLASDEEWFEEISDYLSPSHELQRWNQYLRLKKEFND